MFIVTASLHTIDFAILPVVTGASLAFRVGAMPVVAMWKIISLVKNRYSKLGDGIPLIIKPGAEEVHLPVVRFLLTCLFAEGIDLGFGFTAPGSRQGACRQTYNHWKACRL